MPAVREYAKVAWKSVKRARMHSRLRGLVSWQPMRSPQPGYTVVIAAMHRLWPVLVANLNLVARMRTPLMREVIVVFDCEEGRVPPSVIERVGEWRGSGLAVRIVGYSSRQADVARSIQWGWVYSWMSWCIGIGAASTRRVLLHDLDALPIDAGLFEDLFRSAESHDAHFQGARTYVGCGVRGEMNLVTTFEMVLDAQWLRGRFDPYDGFNKVRLVSGRHVDFDTFLWVQQQAPQRRVQPIDDRALVHPSQLICQFTDHVAGRGSRTSPVNRLPMLAYFVYLGDPTFDLSGLASALGDCSVRAVPIWGKPLAVDLIPPETWAWMEKQIRRLEQHLHGSTRPEIEDYLVGFKLRAGEHRTVGVEPIDEGGVEDR